MGALPVSLNGAARRRTDMKRLTYFDGGKWRLKIGDMEYSGKAVDRLAAIEDILGDEYDLDRLHELDKADKEDGTE